MKLKRFRAIVAMIILGAVLAGCGEATSVSPTTTAASTTTPAATTLAAISAAAATTAPATTAGVTSANATTAISTTASATTPAATTGDATTAPAGAASQDWTTYHKDNARTGYVSGEKDPKSMSKKWSAQVDGAVYAEPLVVGSHVIVATEGNTLYSLNAATGQVEWQTNFGVPVPRSLLPCGNIDPTGITGTPVYDPATGLVFAVAFSKVATSGGDGVMHLLVAVDAQTGKEKFRRPVDLPGASPAPHQQRGALALNNGMVYITYGGLFGDCGNYLGTVIGARTDNTGDLVSYKVPTTREGGIWAPTGPVIDSNGRLYVAVGNGEQTKGEWDKSDSVLRLSPDLKLEDGFAPANWGQENAADADLGSMGPALLPNGLIFIAGKGRSGYTMKASALGGVGGQLQEMNLCSGFGGAAVVGTRVFVPCTSGLREVKISDDGKMTTGWQAGADITGSPIVGGQTVYSLGRDGSLYALNSETGQQRAKLALGSAVNRFATPTLANGTIFVGTMKSVEAVSLEY